MSPLYNRYNPLYETCANVTLGSNDITNCEDFLYNLCQDDYYDYAFNEYCNRRADRFFTQTVLDAYDQVVDRWRNNDREASFAQRGWESHHPGRDNHNILGFCNNTMTNPNKEARIDRCDTWFEKICNDNPEVDAERYPWCACMKDQGYDMNYYDPDSYVFNNPNVSGPGVTVLPNNPYCYVDKCRQSSAAYKRGENLRGEHGCPTCINVMNPENVIFINSKVTQVCQGEEFDEEDIVSSTPPTPPATWMDYLWVAGVAIGSFTFVVILVVLIRKRTVRKQKKVQEDVFGMALAVSND